MYRLPTQFDASASRQDLAAAGGGSTSTTCSSCIVTLLGTSVLSAVVLGRLEPVTASDAGTAGETSPGQPPPAAPSPPQPDTAVARQQNLPVQPSGRGARRLLGAFALPLAAMGGGFVGSLAGAAFGLFVGAGLFIAIYAISYERSGRPLGRGIGMGIAILLGLVAVGAVEMAIWLGLMK